MFNIRRQFVAGIMAATLVGFASSTAQAQPASGSGPSGPSGGGQAQTQEPNRVQFTKESLPQMLKQLGYAVTEKSFPNGRLYWQIVAQINDWRFTVNVLPLVGQGQNQDKITCLMLSSDLGRKVSPQAGAQELSKLLQWNHQSAYLMYFGYNADTGHITFQRPYVFPDAAPEELRAMFNDFFKNIRDTYPLWNSLSGADKGGAAPAGNAQAPAQPAAAKNITGTTWTGNENLAGFGKLTFVFRANGAATMIDARGETAGTWTQNGNDVNIRFDGCVYEGRINGQTLSGSGRLTAGPQQGQTWTFQISLQKS